MRGLMMDMPLLIGNIVRHAERVYPQREVVSLLHDGRKHRQSYAETFARARRLSSALQQLGIEAGDRVATLAWNDHRHLECYYGISCLGAVCHTVNPRLFPEQIAYILDHAADRWLVTDTEFLPVLAGIAKELESLEGLILLAGAGEPSADFIRSLDYEELLAGGDPDFAWPEFDERTAAALCYTSGTTGHPKGVLYSHRSVILHSYAGISADGFGLSARDIILPVVPMFHVNAWGIPYAAPMAGAGLVLPGRHAGNPRALTELLNNEAVSITAGVPTVWQALVDYLDEEGLELPGLERLVVGGSAPSLALIQRLMARGIEVRPAWGMTETSPLGTVNTPARRDAARSDEELVRAGRPIFGIELRIVDDSGQELPWDGQAFGALQVRGPWVCARYYGSEDSAPADWFDTGDVATIDPSGSMQITDRTKDVIKSGGEWISSIELENIAMAHPAVQEAAVIGRPHPKWDERPLLVVVLRDGVEVSEQELLDFYQGKVAKWWIPDAVAFVDEIPHTATGKISKLKLKERLRD
ncbi:MAG: fatty-acid--CoA ligase [Gammaproteobacteria bacterium]|nr:MAG: fatty-acid--CoA ligase [Gammaproteobacteria bacterium]